MSTSQTASTHAGRPRIVLFAEDFDAPPRVIVLDDDPADASLDPPSDAPAEPPPPPISPAMLEAACAEARAEGIALGRTQARAERDEAIRATLAAIQDQLATAEAGLQAHATLLAERAVRLLIALLDQAFPALCARFGPAELQRFTAAVLAIVADAPRIAVRVNPAMADVVAAALAAVEPDLRRRVEVQAHPAMPPGDARIAWPDAVALRDAPGLWTQLRAALVELDLADALPAEPAGALRVASAA